jgi:hypothetical protein
LNIFIERNEMRSSENIKRIVILLFVSGILFLSYALQGIVTDGNDTGIEGASIELINMAFSTTSAADGTWSIDVPIGVKRHIKKEPTYTPMFDGGSLHFIVAADDEPVNLSVYGLAGRHLYTVLNRQCTAGFYRLNVLKSSLSAGMYAVRLQIGDEITFFRAPVPNNSLLFSQVGNTEQSGFGDRLGKNLVTIDSVRVSKAGFAPASVPVGSYDDSLTIVLESLTPSYYLNPPDPCCNQFHVDSCIPGDPNSACGGNCIVANACSPPEDASKADLPKTFICPRFMLFSTEMLEAAKDDAKLYGWEGEEPPFNYGVVGHDPDQGGLDDGPSSCCQCYQIVYVEPEPSSPQPPELPYPKPLIVQSFNTAASGPKGFDVFMGAGGYGAFNACYDDPAFGNTTNFDEFIYDEYPWQNPGGGGISFLRYETECRAGEWPPTIAALQSSACQDKIEEMCNQAYVAASKQITEDTRRSCIETNKVESLYHQNWKVMAKRVRCPDNLTRVTGCRLVEEHLPLPIPSVQTPDDAIAEGSFSDGYHTTTMQDCCKPTCAWQDWVVGDNYKLPADGEWNSFYSCDKNGVPITK